MISNWAWETMKMINELTPDIKDKAFQPGWFLLRERLEDAGRIIDIHSKVKDPSKIICEDCFNKLNGVLKNMIRIPTKE